MMSTRKGDRRLVVCPGRVVARKTAFGVQSQARSTMSCYQVKIIELRNFDIYNLNEIWVFTLLF
jgi:hypothetical protein